jgi:thiol-disulfide isomerase/thioredoxin
MEIVHDLKTRADFLERLTINPGFIIIKFGAPWCAPCRKIKTSIDLYFSQLSKDGVMCCDLNVDQCSDVYAFLKSKKMVTGIPAILCYKRGNVSYIPDDSVSGSDMNKVHAFFERIK